MGNDADRVEFRFRDANTRLDLKCQRTAVPGTWLTVSHISGPTLIQTIQNVRQARARVEGPEHTEQFGQLAAVHEHWFNWAVAENAEDVGCLFDFIGDLDEGNFHITATSKLWTRAPEIVNPKAIAEMQHQEAGLAAPFGPPAITEGAWRHVAERVVAASSADEPVVSTSAQADFELASRSFNNAPPIGPRITLRMRTVIRRGTIGDMLGPLRRSLQPFSHPRSGRRLSMRRRPRSRR